MVLQNTTGCCASCSALCWWHMLGSSDSAKSCWEIRLFTRWHQKPVQAAELLTSKTHRKTKNYLCSPTANLESLINLMCMFLDTEHMKGTHTERPEFKPLWCNNANHCPTMPSQILSFKITFRVIHMMFTWAVPPEQWRSCSVTEQFGIKDSTCKMISIKNEATKTFLCVFLLHF